MNLEKSDSFGAERGFGLAIALMAAGLMLTAVGCSSDAPAAGSCSSHSDCEVGKVCGADDKCVVESNCEFCEGVDELVCIETEDDGSVCSKPECQSNEDCSTLGEKCIQGVCKEEECSTNEDCPEGEICNSFGTCAMQGDVGTPADTGSSDAGMSDIDDSDDTEGDGGTEPDTADDRDAGSCDEVQECPANPDSDAEYWSSEFCSCVECRNDSQCSGDKECRDGSCGAACTQSCSGTGGDNSCPGDKPYCISECCVECIGAMDCPDGELCVDDQCTPSDNEGDCTEGDCPTGYTCNSESGKCEQEGSNQGCSQSDPSCPEGETCNVQNGTCEPVSGGQDCGSCNAGCTCPGQGTCDPNFFQCTNCELTITGESKGCPDGQTCVPANALDPGLPAVCMSL